MPGPEVGHGHFKALRRLQHNAKESLCRCGHSGKHCARSPTSPSPCGSGPGCRGRAQRQPRARAAGPARHRVRCAARVGRMGSDITQAALTTTTLASSRWRRKSRSSAPPMTAGWRASNPDTARGPTCDCSPSECRTSSASRRPRAVKLLNLGRHHPQRPVVRNQASRCAATQHHRGNIAHAGIGQLSSLGRISATAATAPRVFRSASWM